MPCCEISDCAQMSKTIIAVRHFGLGGRESLETAVSVNYYNILKITTYINIHGQIFLDPVIYIYIYIYI